MQFALRIYDLLLYAYPKRFRERFGPEMRQVFRDRWRESRAAPRRLERIRFAGFMFKDWILSSLKERMASMSTGGSTRLWSAAKALGAAALTAAICLLAGSTMLRAYVISAPSMEGSLRVGDHILVNRLVHGEEIRRGDLVVFRFPEDPSQIFVKRVIGMAGDHIRLADKQVIRNGRRLVEPYAEHGAKSVDQFRDNFPSGRPGAATPQHWLDRLERDAAGGEVVVPTGSLFVLGDNRDFSLDSRYWGFVPMANILGRPVLVYWSYDAATMKTRWNRTLLNLGAAQPQEEAP